MLIDMHTYLAFVAATALLIAIPGPTAMLVTSLSVRRGVRAGLTAVAGSSMAVITHLTIRGRSGSGPFKEAIVSRPCGQERV
jgi:threonine/homoserine/homoserine lactone efflux protein